jgi:hypothetical protein
MDSIRNVEIQEELEMHPEEGKMKEYKVSG